MNELKVGNFKSKTSQYEDIDLSKVPPVEPTEPVEPVDEPIVTPTDPVNEPVEPVSPTEPAQPNNEPSSLTPNTPEPEPVVEFEFDEDKTFKYLSEKLGKDIKSLDDLKQTQTENPLDSDPYLKKLHEWRTKTGRPIEDWIKYQKDYSKMSDLDVARETLQHEYPSLTPAEIDAELKSFIPNDLDDEEDISTKARNLKKYSTKGRDTLQKLVSDLGDVPQQMFSPEVQQDLKLAKQVKQDYIANQKASEEYNNKISTVAKSVDSLKLSLSDDLTIDFKVSDESKKTLPEMVTTMPHWKNKDGSWNHQSIVEDAIIIKHYKDMIRLAFEQGKNSGEEEIIKQTNNTTLGEPTPMSGVPSEKKGVEIEGFEDFVGKSSMRLRFNK
jgi:hypothetical protein